MKISMDDLAFFNRQLASMVRLKTPLAEGIDILARECNTANFKKVLEGIGGELSEGKPLSQALSSRPEVFSPAYIAIVEAAEQSGDIATPLERMADYSETSLELKSSLFYVALIPFITLCSTIVVTLFLVTFILPKFKEIFLSLGAELPGVTLILLDVSNFYMSYHLSISFCLIFVAMFLLISYWTRAMWLETVLWNLPFIGELIRTSHYTRFCIHLSHLLEQSIPLGKSLELMGLMFKSPLMRGAISDMKEAVENGNSFSEQMKSSGIFPESMVWKISFAEKKGNLAEAFGELHRYFLHYFRALVPRFVYIFGPVLVIGVALFVGFVVTAMFLPIFQLQNHMAGG